MGADPIPPRAPIYPFLSLDGAAALPRGADPSAAARAKVRPRARVGHLFSLSSDPNDLAAQRWGIVRTDDAEGARLEQLVARLTARRRSEQGDHPVVVYPVPRGLDAEASEDFVRLRYHSESTRAEDRPRYLLLLGDADGVSWELQRSLALHGAFPGRLAFDAEAGYEAYVEKALTLADAAVDARKALYFAMRGESASIREGMEHLLLPSRRALRDEKLPSVVVDAVQLALTVPDSAGLDSDVRDLLSRAAVSDGGLLISLSHGLGLARGASIAERREKQGAMVIEGRRVLTARDLATQPFFKGGAWFFLACFSAGTPAASAYEPWLRDLGSSDTASGADDVLATLPDPPSPFTAALPKALLASPEGPLAIVGHVDLAWTYGFAPATRSGQDTVYLRRHERYHQVFKSLLLRRRFGAALSELSLVASSVGSGILAMDEADRGRAAPDAPRLAERAYRWLEHNDLGAFVLLGDPAARLPMTRSEAPRIAPAARSAAPSEEPSEEVLSVEGHVIACLSEATDLRDFAPSKGYSEKKLQQLIDAYRDAGRRALAEIVSASGWDPMSPD